MGVGVAMTLLLTGCDARADEKAPPAQPAPAATVAGNPAPFCRIEGVKCGTADAAGVPVEYGIIPAQQQDVAGQVSSRGLLLVEAGGPGFDLYDRADKSFLTLPAPLQRFDLLLLREPWARTEPAGACRQALRVLGQRLSDATDPPVGSVTAACTMRTWDARSYVAAVNAVVAAERPVTGILGQSYGALPAAAAAREWPDAWLVLNAPIAPVGSSAWQLMQGRQKALTAALDASYATVCKRLRLDCSVRGSAVAARAVNSMAATHSSPSRSAPLRTGDLQLAIMAAAYELGVNQTWLWKTVATPGDRSEKDWLTLGRLADQLSQRSGGDGAVSPRLAAYFSGICSSYTGWRTIGARDRQLHLLLRAIVRQCAEADHRQSAWNVEQAAPKRSGPVCLLVNTADPVVEARAARAWIAVFPGTRVRTYSYLGHLSLDRAYRQSQSGAACEPLPAGAR